VKFGVPIIDIVTGLYCVISILTALRVRDMTGRGTYIDLALTDSAISILTHQAAHYLASGEVPRGSVVRIRVLRHTKPLGLVMVGTSSLPWVLRSFGRSSVGLLVGRT